MPPGLGASLVRRWRGDVCLRLPRTLLLNHDHHPQELWTGGFLPEDVANQRRAARFASEGPVRPLEALLLRACPAAAPIAHRSERVADLRGCNWAPRRMEQWLDTALSNYDAGDQKVRGGAARVVVGGGAGRRRRGACCR